MSRKPITWMGSTLEDLRAFPDKARNRAGFELDAVQQGEMPSDFKPMKSVGPGTFEMRISAEPRQAHRVFYVAKFEEAIYVLHAFEKKTQKTARQDIQIGKRRYQEMLELREDLRGER